MPTLRFVEHYPHPPAVVFDFFRRPANVLAVAPPSLDLRLVEGPDEVKAGSVFVAQLRRFGLSQRIETEVSKVEVPTLLVEKQTRGPFPRWALERRFEASGEGTRLTETIEYEPPGGLLGLVLSPERIEEELRQAYQGRVERVLGRLSAS